MGLEDLLECKSKRMVEVCKVWGVKDLIGKSKEREGWGEGRRLEWEGGR